MFNYDDNPVIMKDSYTGPNATVSPPLFTYCTDDVTLDIVFPDWSFSGWPEINIKPWEFLLEELKEGNDKVKWTEREPYAYWKENPRVLKTRQDLLKCKATDKVDWNACLYA
ncbi:hypothetical protein IFM89_008512 [Coptis chinensis]|uniref:Glycosyl transferase CAP10 domain-containing protein n=1 Tax=Coptis chinensis TaxID=261450 RepID=A0A835HDC9_9MAGN|nr:hypothetical protein IFM89_008512 [Coptis chinensis]